MAVGVQKAWSPVAATNASSDSNANWAEGMLAPGINNSARANMAAIKAWANQIQGGCTYGGSANAYTITSDATGAISTAYANGMAFMLKANHTNTGAATLNVDGVGAVAIKTSDGGALAAGDIVSGGLYLLAYESATPSFQIVNTIAGGSYQPLDATLTAIAALDFSTAGSMMYSTAADTFSLLTTTAAGRTLLGLADPGADRLTFWDDSETSFAHLTLGTGLSISTTTLSLDAQLVDVAGLTPTDNGVIIGNGTNFVVESGATLKTSLGLTIGTNVQAYSSVLDTFAANGLTSDELTQLQNIGSNTLGATQWAALASATGNFATAAYVADNTLVHLAGTETVTGAKSLSSLLTLTQSNGALAIESSLPRFRLFENDQAANQGRRDFLVSGGILRFTVSSDDGTSLTDWLRVLSTTTTVDEVELNATTFDLNGALDLSGNASVGGTLDLSGTTNQTLDVSSNRLRIEGVNVVTTSSTDTLTNKTLTSPTINGGTSTASGGTGTTASGTLVAADANCILTLTGGITVPNGVFSARQMQVLDPGTSSRTITRGASVTMYVNGTDSASATLSANQMGGIYWRSSSVCVLTGAVA